MELAARIGTMARRGAPLPYDAEVEWLGFSGSYATGKYNLINTNVPMNSIKSLTIKVDWRGYNGARREICGGDTSSSYSFEVNTNGLYGTSGTNTIDAPLGEGDILTWRRTVGQRPTLTLNGEQTITDSLLRDPVGTFKIPVVSFFPVNLKLYSLVIVNHDDQTVFDGIPVRFANEQGRDVGAVYDKITRSLFVKIGNVDFVIGPDKVGMELAGGGINA